MSSYILWLVIHNFSCIGGFYNIGLRKSRWYCVYILIQITNTIILYLNKDKDSYKDDYGEDVIKIHKELKESIDKANKNYKVYFRTPECKVYEGCNVHIATEEGSGEKVIMVDLKEK